VGGLNNSNVPPNAIQPGVFGGAPPGSTYVPAAMNPDGSITPGYFLPPPNQPPPPPTQKPDDCPTCTVPAAQRTGPTVVNYEEVDAGPVQLTHYFTPDGSLNMYGLGFAPGSTDVGIGAGSCLASPFPGNTVADDVSGAGTGLSASTGTGVAGSVSGNSSGVMACTGLSAGTPGASPTLSYTATPSDWGSMLTPTPEQADAMYKSIM
jgi:hypothetical protein